MRKFKITIKVRNVKHVLLMEIIKTTSLKLDEFSIKMHCLNPTKYQIDKKYDRKMYL